jgi:hypothetical protein
MEEKDFLKTLSGALFVIGLFPEIDNYFKQIKVSIEGIELIDYLFEPVKEESGSDKTVKMMFFDTKLIHEINVNVRSISYNSYQIKNIDSICLDAQNNRKLGEQKGTKTIDTLKLEISFLDQKTKLSFESDSSKFIDYLRIKNNLLTLLVNKKPGI